MSRRKAAARPDFSGYFRALADRLALKDWTITVSPEPPDDGDAYATITPIEGRKVATVRLADDFFSASREVQRHIACHELIHCHWAQADAIASGATTGLATASYSLAAEYAVDALAGAIAPHMPLPRGRRA